MTLDGIETFEDGGTTYYKMPSDHPLLVAARKDTNFARPFIILERYLEECEICGAAESHHAPGIQSEKKPTHYLCNTCMNDWSEWCDERLSRGFALKSAGKAWEEWFAEFKESKRER